MIRMITMLENVEMEKMLVGLRKFSGLDLINFTNEMAV